MPKTAAGAFRTETTNEEKGKIPSITIIIEGSLTRELIIGIGQELDRRLPQPPRVSAIHPALVFDFTKCHVPPEDAQAMAQMMSLVVTCNEGLARKILRGKKWVADVSILVVSVNDPLAEALMGQGMENYLKVVGEIEWDIILLQPNDTMPIAVSAEDFGKGICPHCGQQSPMLFCRSMSETTCYKCLFCFQRFLVVGGGAKISSIGCKFLGREGKVFFPEVQAPPFPRNEKRKQEILDELGKRGIQIILGGVVALGDPLTPEEQELVDELTKLVGSSTV